MQSIVRGGRFRTAAAAAGLAACLAGASAAAARAQVSGRITITDAGGKAASDVGNAVVWLEGHAPRGTPASIAMTLDGRTFSPRVVVVPVGSVVSFPNRDPFNHNVFSLSDGNEFDLGLYSRGESAEHRFRRAGVVRVYCNIHPRMSGFVVVVDNVYYAQPGADGSYEIHGVAPGTYTLHVWHERAPEVTQELEVPAAGLGNVDVSLDARGFKLVAHKDKNGKDYTATGVRY